MPDDRDNRPWYHRGLRFTCQLSGACCTNHGDYAYVYLTADDERRLAAHLGVTLAAFRRQHTRRLDGGRILRNQDDACRFLDDGRCGVYQARPVQCSTWPFWHTNLTDEKTWQTEVVAFCAGAGEGQLHDRETIEATAGRHDEGDGPDAD